MTSDSVANEEKRLRHQGKVALVSGAASGIGQAYAVRLASEGADIVIADVQGADETVRRVRETGRQALAVACDISLPDEVEKLGRLVEQELGRCDILVNNAGLVPSRPIEELTFEEWRRVMAVNLDAVFLLSRRFYPGMRIRAWGRIINMASNTFGQVIGGMAHYIASKGGVIGFTRALASELGPYGITVNAIAPGLTKTPATTALGGVHRGMSQEELFDAVAKKQAIPRGIRPADLAGTLSFLASEDAALITGQTIYVDGGLVRV